MWIFTTKGFISAVAWQGCKRTLCVRARNVDHLRDLFPGKEILVNQAADYRYRCRIERKYFQAAIDAEIKNLDYTNFKKQIYDHRYHDACMDVWHAMHRLQEPEQRVYGGHHPDLWNPGNIREVDEPGDDPDEELPWPEAPR